MHTLLRPAGLAYIVRVEPRRGSSINTSSRAAARRVYGSSRANAPPTNAVRLVPKPPESPRDTDERPERAATARRVARPKEAPSEGPSDAAGQGERASAPETPDPDLPDPVEDDLAQAEIQGPRSAARPLNRGDLAASNREVRKREAEEDRELIDRAQRGDRQAFRALVERHQRSAYSVALGIVRDEQDAREIVQEAFLRVHKGLSTFQGGSSFFTWLYRIVHNLAIDLVRKPGRREEELQEERTIESESELALVSRVDGADPVQVLRRREIAARIQTALDALPPYHRGVIIMREIEGLSYEEMAQAMQVSKGTIMSRLFHARQKLQRALADCYAEEDVGKTGSQESGQEGESDE